MVDLPDGRFAVAVGDVVGHGLEAAALMGMLRSALRGHPRPGTPGPSPGGAGPLRPLTGRCAEHHVAKALVDPASNLIIYSSAGHLPPVERRGEDIETSLARLTDSLAQCGHLPLQDLADTLLTRLGVAGGASDAIALIIARCDRRRGCASAVPEGACRCFRTFGLLDEHP
ncbi:SpoIIE family protein phosphatase [Spirillospora sp. NPDC048832]